MGDDLLIPSFVASIVGSLIGTLFGGLLIGMALPLRSLGGPLLGAAVLAVPDDYISSTTVNWISFIGAIFIVVVPC
jgi:branched-subunit amino acid ABC-type transport system permease component